MSSSALQARRAGLKFIDHHGRGYTRRARGTKFEYVSHTGRLLSDARTLDRIRMLAIPPAWRDVWISPDPRGHIQATGLDVRGRLQYRYHNEWTAQRNLTKFSTLHSFARKLPAIRAHVRRDLRLPGIPREKVIACIVRLLDTTMIRIGNDEYARTNNSFGLTTIRNRHVRVHGAEIDLRFKAKSGKDFSARLRDPIAARIIRRCQELPGQELFSFKDELGKTHRITSTDVNVYLHAIGGEATAKDFRTWGGTVTAVEMLLTLGEPIIAETREPLSAAELKRREVAAVRAASEALSNTVAVCRKFYVHPHLIHAYAAGAVHGVAERVRGARSPRTFTLAERVVIGLMRTRALRPQISSI